MMTMRRILLLIAVPLLCVACASVGPDYKRPQIADMPAGWKTEPAWQAATPADAIPKKEWWKAFGDKQLDELEANCLKDNTNQKETPCGGVGGGGGGGPGATTTPGGGQ